MSGPLKKLAIAVAILSPIGALVVAHEGAITYPSAPDHDDFKKFADIAVTFKVYDAADPFDPLETNETVPCVVEIRKLSGGGTITSFQETVNGMTQGMGGGELEHPTAGWAVEQHRITLLEGSNTLYEISVNIEDAEM